MTQTFATHNGFLLNLSGSKTASATSIFGDLGGTWSITSGGSTEPGGEAPASCTIVLAGSTITGECVKSQSRTTLNATFDLANGLVSGTTNVAFEFTANRR